MPGGVIDEFLIKIGMEGDPSGLIDAYKQLMKSQEQFEQKSNESEQQESQNDDKKQKRAEALKKLQAGVNTAVSGGVGLAKKGVSMARNWAVALLAVDGAAMAVVGRLSQMAVEYDNTAGSINMAASEMKAWEDTLKSAGGKADDVTGSLQNIYDKAFKTMMGEGEAGFQTAMAAFGVQTAEGGIQRETGDIFSDIIKGFRDAVESGMDLNLAIGYLEEAGISRQLAQPLLRQDEGGYIATEELFKSFLDKAKPLDDLADASLGLTGIITELSATFREKFARVLLELVESGVLEDMLTQLTAFVAGLDVEKISNAVQDLIGAFEKLFSFISFLIPGTKARQEFEESTTRKDALIDAIKEQLSFFEYQKFAGPFGEARGKFSPGGSAVIEMEAQMKAEELGLDVNQIFQQAGLPTLNNSVNVYIDGKDIPYSSDEYQNYSSDASAVDSGLIQ
ncbi:hypothetical protein KAR91_12995 [Candidatus Pacearchaeota archaeon]|nr:hypothetical protein [Candidatus Pacearchaeota archaeon]